MKTLTNYFALFLLILGVLSCKENPTPVTVADFTYVADEADPLTVSFTNTSINASSYEWNFGDENVSFEESPRHTYVAAGTYTITLVASSSGNNEFHEVKKTIIVSEPPVRYMDMVYSASQVVKSSGIKYGSHAVHNTLDLFQVAENDDSQRPLILLSPGGGFLKYSRIEDLEDMAQDLAQRGYVTAVVKYTIDSELDRTDQVATSLIWMQAMQDQKSAIRFFKNNASEYKIDPNKIFIGGWSNGATVALTTAFFQQDEVETIGNENMKTLISDRINEIGFEGNENPGVDSSVKGALILNGYAFDVDFIDADDPSLMIIYHEESQLLDGTLILDTFTAGTDTYYGLKPLVARAKQVGYADGADLESIIMTGFLNQHPNYAPLEDINYNTIADFFYRNLE